MSENMGTTPVHHSFEPPSSIKLRTADAPLPTGMIIYLDHESDWEYTDQCNWTYILKKTLHYS